MAVKTGQSSHRWGRDWEYRANNEESLSRIVTRIMRKESSENLTFAWYKEDKKSKGNNIKFVEEINNATAKRNQKVVRII